MNEGLAQLCSIQGASPALGFESAILGRHMHIDGIPEWSDKKTPGRIIEASRQDYYLTPEEFEQLSQNG